MEMEANDSNSCLFSSQALPIFTAWFAVYLLLLPILLYVLYIGCKQWRNHTSGFSHSDVFTFHMVALELCTIVSSLLFYVGFYNGAPVWAMIGGNGFSLSLVAQMQFHGLTCVERYLAVVHPITYLRLKRGGGVTIRNVSVGAVWLLSLGHVVLTQVLPFEHDYKFKSALVLGVVSLAVTGFFSISVMCVLIRPGPGEGGRDKIDQTKCLALETVVTIQVVLLMRFVGFLTGNVVPFGGGALDRCSVVMAGLWFGFPSSLVLPLLFLKRAGKLTCFTTRK